MELTRRDIGVLALGLLGTPGSHFDTLPTLPIKPEPSPPPPADQLRKLKTGSTEFDLLAPAIDADAASLTTWNVHFHTVMSTSGAQHRKRGLKGPLIVINLGTGSAAYGRPFTDPGLLPRILEVVGAALVDQRPGLPLPVSLEISSFSAGYGAVRELLQQEDNAKLIQRIHLCDSLYAGYEKEGDPDSGVAAKNIEPWLPFVRLAAKGERRFALTYSQVPTAGYATTRECAQAIAKAVGLEIKPRVNGEPVDPSVLASIERADQGRLHLWGYAGNDGPAHMAHVRNLALMWKSVDQIDQPAKP